MLNKHVNQPKKKINNEMKEIYFHIGLPKSASTFLRDSIITNKYIYNFHQNRAFEDLIYLIQLSDFENINSLINKNKKKFDRIFLEINSVKQKKILISGSGILGTGEDSFYYLKKRLHTIKTLFPNAKILFVLRNQVDWIGSLFKHFIRFKMIFYSVHPNFFDLRKFVSFKKKNQHKNIKKINLYYLKLNRLFDKFNHSHKKNFDKRELYLLKHPQFNIYNLDYESIINNINKLFKNKKLILFYEELSYNRREFEKRLINFLGPGTIKTLKKKTKPGVRNKSMSEFSFNALKFMSRYHQFMNLNFLNPKYRMIFHFLDPFFFFFLTGGKSQNFLDRYINLNREFDINNNFLKKYFSKVNKNLFKKINYKVSSNIRKKYQI